MAVGGNGSLQDRKCRSLGMEGEPRLLKDFYNLLMDVRLISPQLGLKQGSTSEYLERPWSRLARRSLSD